MAILALFLFRYFSSSVLLFVISYLRLITSCDIVPLAIYLFIVNCNYISTLMMLRDATKR